MFSIPNTGRDELFSPIWSVDQSLLHIIAIKTVIDLMNNQSHEDSLSRRNLIVRLNMLHRKGRFRITRRYQGQCKAVNLMEDRRDCNHILHGGIRTSIMIHLNGLGSKILQP
jgi:hypothetical protein